MIWPINSETVDLDGDGDSTSSVARRRGRIFWFENSGHGSFEFTEHDVVDVESDLVTPDANRPPFAVDAPALVNGFNMAFVDLERRRAGSTSSLREYSGQFVWLEQPTK